MNYIGSKLSLIEFIDESISEVTSDIENPIFCDIFSGTSIVGQHFKKKKYNVISNDLQYYSYVLTKHFVKNDEEIEFLGLQNKKIDPFSFLNELEGTEGFIYNNYSLGGTQGKEYERLYFSDENALKIDAIRAQIEIWKEEDLLRDNEYTYLITCLLEAADKVANTASVYEAYLKKLKKSAQKEMEVLPLEVIVINESKTYEVYNKDANELIREIKGDILYLDPPYNRRRYDTNYHILETIALNDEPQIKGKTGIRETNEKRSSYNLKREAKDSFEDLIKNANFEYIFLSYNDEGIISFEEIKSIMEKYGTYKYFDTKYKRFKADSNKNRNHAKNSTVEYIHCLIKSGDFLV